MSFCFPSNWLGKLGIYGQLDISVMSKQDTNNAGGQNLLKLYIILRGVGMCLHQAIFTHMSMYQNTK